LDRADSAIKEIANTIRDCHEVLSVLDEIVRKYNALSERERGRRKLWSMARFGNGEMQDLGNLKQKLQTFASVITLQLNLVSLAFQGHMERKMDS
jgi:hypothetical protein